MYRMSRWVSIALAAGMLLTVLSASGTTLATGSISPAAGVNFGVVTIAADGSISNTSAPISVAGSLYRLTGPMNGSIVVLASGIVLDGAGYAINYTAGDGAAVTVSGTTGVTVENFRSTNATIGILVNNTTGSSVQGNSVRGSAYDIEVTNSTAALVAGNNETGPATGIGTGIGYASHVTVSSNDASRTATGFDVWNSTVVALTGNTADATTLEGTYITGSTGVTVHANFFEAGVGYALLAESSSGVTVSGNNGNGSSGGFEADYSFGTVFIGNNVSHETSTSSSGIGGTYDTNLRILRNVAYGSYYGARYEYSSQILVENNTFRNVTYGFYDYGDQGLWVAYNYAPAALSYGVYSDYSTNVTYLDNNLSRTVGYATAIYLDESGNATVSGNNLSNSYDGVETYSMYGPLTIVDNQISNTTYPVYLYYGYAPTWVTGNDLSGSSAYPSYYGVYIYETYGAVTVTNNSIPYSEYGIYAEYTYDSLTIAGNNISNSTSYAIYTYEAYGALNVTGNDLANASYAAVYQDGYSYGQETVSGNDIRFSGEYGVYAYYLYGGVSVTNNDLANASYYGVYLEYTYGAISVLGNNLSGSYYGVYLYEGYSGATVVGNDISFSYTGVDSEYMYGSVNVSDNRIVNSSYAIYLYEDYGSDVVVGNSVQNALDAALSEYYFDGPGGFTLAGNNASGSYYALYLYDNYYVYASEVVGNDLSGSAEVYVYDSYLLGGFVANNLLNDAYIYFGYNELGPFYHNDLNSTAFSQSANFLATSSWNAAYPLGGNYWTNYTGTDAYSGVFQNLTGSDGIGDTPYTVGGATDRYPLMAPWISPTVTYREVGLPSTATWTVTFNGVSETALAGQSIAFPQVNGAYTPYAYSVAWSDARYAASPASGSGVLTGAARSITVSFTPFEYAVTFNETGLASGTSWSVTLNGVTRTSTVSTVGFTQFNGSYVYAVSAVAGYQLSTPVSGSVSVSGAAVLVDVKFGPVTYAVDFVVVGLPSGLSWSVNLSGALHTSTGANTSFAMPNGTYAFAIVAPNGYTITPSSGHVTVGGSTVTVYLAAYSASGGPGGQGSATTSSWTDGEVYGLIAALVVALLIALVAGILYLRARGRASGPTGPAPWSAGPAPGAVLSPPPASAPAQAPPAPTPPPAQPPVQPPSSP